MNETVKALKDQLKQKDKEIKFLRDELNNLTKPVRDRRNHIEVPKPTHEEWKVDFIKRFKRDVLGET